MSAVANAATRYRPAVVERSPEDLNRLALSSLMAGAVDRYRRAIESGDEFAAIAAITDLDKLKNEARDLKRATGLLFKCDGCSRDFPSNRITVGAVTLCLGCAS